MKKVLYIEIDEEITSIVDRVKHLNQKSIYVVVPRKALLFQSLVNLKILRQKLDELDKELILVTTDTTGTHLAKKMGIEVANRVEVEKIEQAQEEIPQMGIRPVQARRNEVTKDTPRRFTEKKITIAELIKEFRLRSKHQKKDENEVGSSLQFMRPNRKFLSLILMVSIGLFALIGYIALPQAAIYIKPTFDHIDHTVNVTLADKRKNQNMLRQNQPNVIASEEVVTITKQTKVFNTTSQDFYGENAKGKITIINTTNEDWTFKAGTRFQTEEGIIFHTGKEVTVPPGSADEENNWIPGKLVVQAEASPFDAFGKPVGDLGNIPPSRFIIPGLTKFNQRKVWGESYEPMTGGVTHYRKVVRDEDIEAAKKQIKDNLILTSKDELRTYVESKNKLNHTNLVILDDRRYVRTELLDLRISEDLEGSFRDKFEVFAKIRAQGVAYDFDQLFGLLKRELKNRAHPDMQIRDDSIYPDSITYEVIDEDVMSGLIKITATIKGIEEFIVDPDHEAGERLGNKIKEKISGLKVAEAEKLLSNFPEVDAVIIKMSPIWMSSMPRIADNIKIKPMANDQ